MTTAGAAVTTQHSIPNNATADVTVAAILNNNVVTQPGTSHLVDFYPHGESFPSNTVLFSTPPFPDIIQVDVFEECMSGSCECTHLIGGFPCDLKPCRAACFLFGGSPLTTISEQEREYLWRGLVNGFSIVDEDCPSSYNCGNYDSITGEKYYKEMSSLLQDEMISGKVTLSDSQPRCVHSLGAVEKSNGKLRPITDCSRPEGTSINNYMSSTFESFSYNSVDDAVSLLSRGNQMAVVDISAAYRSVNVAADQAVFQGLSWDFGEGPVWLIDRRLCFGLRCAPNIYNAISDFIVKIARSWGADRVVNYLDDFLIIADDFDSCLAHRTMITSAIEFLGASVSWKKVTSPSTTTTFLGITIDSERMELSLPKEKVKKLEACLTSLLDKGCATKKDLERAGGLVSHCSYVVRGGRTFSRRIFDLAASYSRSSKAIPLNDNIKADFDWWLAFCSVFNCRACIIQDLCPLPMYSDASIKGFGAWMGLDWFVGSWDSSALPPSHDAACGHFVSAPTFGQTPKNINVYELWPIVAGMKRWASFRNRRIHLITDNMQVLAMINTGRSCNKTCMAWLREIFWCCFINNTDLHASYIKSADNVIADALSRADYPGMPDKCSNLLSDYNMCCPLYFRITMDDHRGQATNIPSLSNGSVDQEVASLPDQLLPTVLP